MQLSIWSRICGSLVLLLMSLQSIAAQTPQSTSAIPSPPKIEARNYVLMDAESGQILVEHESDQQVPPASLTKLMSAYLIFQALSQGRIKLDQPTAVSVAAWKAGGSTMFLQPNLPVTIEQLIQGLVIVSGNDAAVTLAETIAGTTDDFVEIMNATAHQLGMGHSHFDNVDGLPTPTHKVSARDIALLTQDIMRQFPQYLHYFNQQTFTYNNVTQRNWNPLIFSDASVTGMKTGHTNEAGYCLDATAMRKGHRLIAVVLGSKTRTGSAVSAESLLNYGFKFFETVHVYSAGQAITTVMNTWANPTQVVLGVANDVWVTLPTSHGQLKSSISLLGQLPLPLYRGQVIGSLILQDGGKEVSRRPLVALNSVQKTNWFMHLWNSIKAELH